nr:hypothetical protein [Tepidiforma sp.]
MASVAESVSPSVEPVSEDPRPWWETSEAEETIEEAVASAAEPVSPAVEPVAEEPRPWWEASAAEEAVEAAVASVAEPASRRWMSRATSRGSGGKPARPRKRSKRPWRAVLSR